MLKTFPKILTIFFLTVFILQIICLFFLLAAPVASQAADIQFKPQVQGLNYTFNAADKSTGNIANLVKAVYNYAIGIIGILAAVVLMVGGVLWIIAGGNATQIGEAKAWIGAALTGLVLALTSYLILSTVNPALVDLKTTNITSVKEMTTGTATTTGAGTATGSCTTIEIPQVCTDGVTRENCINSYATFNEGGKCPISGCCYFKPASGGNWICDDMTKDDCDKKKINYTFYKDKKCQSSGACN